MDRPHFQIRGQNSMVQIRQTEFKISGAVRGRGEPIGSVGSNKTMGTLAGN